MKRLIMNKLYLVLIAALTLPMLASAQQMESQIGNLTGHADNGRPLYYRYCWGCHGARGNGDGENAPYVTPNPRNFVQGTFKCRSTPTGTLPVDQDLFNTLIRGFNFTNMPSWAALTSQQRADLVAFVKSFSPRFKNEKPGTPIPIPAEPALTVESIKHGQELFQKLECWKCHGQEGRGDGPSAATLTDSNDQPIRPYNFTSSNRSKCGTTNPELYRIFHDRPRRHSDALLCRCDQTGRCLGSGPLSPHFASQQQEPRAHDVGGYQRRGADRERTKS